MLAVLAHCTVAFPFGDAYTRLVLVTVVETIVNEEVHIVLAVTDWHADVSNSVRTRSNSALS